MLQLLNYQKHYGSVPVLQIPFLRLEEGVYWLKGANGAGKTTLLKSIAGLITFEGTIEVKGMDIRKQRMAYLKAVNYAEAEPLYPSFLTGKDLLHFYLQTKGGEKKTAEHLVTAFGMSRYLSHKVATYSSGMVKKLSLVLAFTGQPGLVLLDEPFITLDTAAVGILQELIQERNKAGVSFCISSHDDATLPPFTATLHIHHQKAERV